MKDILLYICVIMAFVMLLILFDRSPKSPNYNHKPIIISKKLHDYYNNPLPNGISEYWYSGNGQEWQSFEDSSYKYNIGDTIK